MLPAKMLRVVTSLKRLSDSKNLFEANLLYLFYVGLWPDKNLSKPKQIVYKMFEYSQHLFAVIFLIVSGIGTFQITGDLTLLLANLDKSIGAYNYFIKVILFTKERDELKDLIDEIIESGDTVSEKSNRFMFNHLLLITGLMTALLVIFSTVGLMQDEMTIEAWMPFDVRKGKMKLAMSAQILAVLFCVPFCYRAIGIQGIICSLLIYMCDQLEDLQDRLRNVKCDNKNERVTRNELKKILTKHMRLMRYAHTLEKKFKIFFLVQNLAVTMELCLNAMMLTVVDRHQWFLIAGFIAFLSLALLNAYFYCYLGHELSHQSVQISQAAYEADFLDWPLDMKKTILLIITVAQRPFKITAGGIAVINMETFGAALYNGYSIFAVLNDVVN